MTDENFLFIQTPSLMYCRPVLGMEGRGKFLMVHFKSGTGKKFRK